MVIFQLVYVSLAADSFSADDLLGLLRQSRENNERADVSGMLLYKERRFLQLLEGDEASVRATFQRIQRDPRHHDITVLLENETDMRDFDDWSMAFQNLDEETARETPGYSKFMNVTLSVFEFASDPSRASSSCASSGKPRAPIAWMIDSAASSSHDDDMRTIVDLPETQIKALDSYRKREGISRAEAFRRAVEAFVPARGKGGTDFAAHPAFGSSKRYRKEDSVKTVRRLREEWR